MITPTNSPRFLIIQTAFIGDVILATAMLEQLHEAYPHAALDILVRKGNEGLLANHPFLNEVLIWHKKGTVVNFKYKDLWRLLKMIRPRQYDAVLNLQRFGTMGLLTMLSEAKITIGFDKSPFARFFTHRLEHRFEPGMHEVDRNASFLSVLGTEQAVGTEHAPGLNFTRRLSIMRPSAPTRTSLMFVWHPCRSGLRSSTRPNAGWN